MTTRTDYARTGTSAAGYYLRQAEAALGIASHGQVSITRDVQRIAMSGCLLYVTTARFWQRQHHGNARATP